MREADLFKCFNNTCFLSGLAKSLNYTWALVDSRSLSLSVSLLHQRLKSLSSAEEVTFFRAQLIAPSSRPGSTRLAPQLGTVSSLNQTSFRSGPKILTMTQRDILFPLSRSTHSHDSIGVYTLSSSSCTKKMMGRRNRNFVERNRTSTRLMKITSGLSFSSQRRVRALHEIGTGCTVSLAYRQYCLNQYKL